MEILVYKEVDIDAGESVVGGYTVQYVIGRIFNSALVAITIYRPTAYCEHIRIKLRD